MTRSYSCLSATVATPRRWVARVALVVAAVCAGFTANASTPMAPQATIAAPLQGGVERKVAFPNEAPLVIRHDPGGSVRKRFHEIRAINARGQKVDIRRGGCLSSCSMYFGALTPKEFEDWSRVIAAHYPAPVRKWYLETARYKGMIPARLSGSELIRLGVPACDT